MTHQTRCSLPSPLSSPAPKRRLRWRLSGAGTSVRRDRRRGHPFHFLPRLESSSRWRELRASDGCALAPDEHAVVSFLLEKARGKCEMITDFVVDGSTPIVLGRKRYFDSKLAPAEAAATLRAVGEQGRRNSYVHRDGNLRLSSSSGISRQDWTDLFSDLGDWCPFTLV